MDFLGGKKIPNKLIYHQSQISLSFFFCCKIILQVFQASTTCFICSIPLSVPELPRSFCSEFVSVHGQENIAVEIETPRQASQELCCCLFFAPSSLVCFHVAINLEKPNRRNLLPSPFHLPAASQRDQMRKSQNNRI